MEDCVTKIGATQAGEAKRGSAQVSGYQYGIAKVGEAQRGFAQIGKSQLRESRRGDDVIHQPDSRGCPRAFARALVW
jgi:hypothetical protein